MGEAYGLWFNNDPINQKFFKMTPDVINLHKAILLHCSRNILEPLNIMACCSPRVHPTVKTHGIWFHFSPQPPLPTLKRLQIKRCAGWVLRIFKTMQHREKWRSFCFLVCSAHLCVNVVNHGLPRLWINKFSVRRSTIPTYKGGIT